MRDIKFRFWDISKGEMTLNNSFFEVQKYNRTEDELFFIVPMQFTGIIDSKGCEVYEGDLLKFKAETTIYIYQVVFENGGFYCYHTAIKDDLGKPLKWGGIWRFAELQFEFKVIGNIYEKPEFSIN